MRYDLTDYEWSVIRPMLPNKPRGMPRVDDRRAQWHLLGFALWRPVVRWRRAGVWGQIMDALAAGHDTAVQVIDTSVVRVHQQGPASRPIENNKWASRGGPSPTCHRRS